MAETCSVYLRRFAVGVGETEGNTDVLPGDGGGLCTAGSSGFRVVISSGRGARAESE